MLLIARPSNNLQGQREAGRPRSEWKLWFQNFWKADQACSTQYSTWKKKKNKKC